VIMGVLAALRMATSIRALTPALIVAVASLLIGLNWIGWLSPRQPDPIATEPSAEPASEDINRRALHLDRSEGHAAAAVSGRAAAAGLSAAAAKEGARPLQNNLAGTADKAKDATPPAALYFNPQLMTDADGRATIQFTMPRVDSDYWLLIDALGHGRFGSRQELIAVGSTPGK
jgi:hypothetical protein